MYGGTFYGQAAPGGDTGGAGGGATPLLQTLVDNFDDNTINLTIWNDYGAPQVAETSNEIHITSTLVAGFYGMNSNATFDMRSSYIFSRLVDSGDLTIASYSAQPVAIQDSTGNLAYIAVNGGIIQASKNLVVGGLSVVATIAYDPVVTKWFKMRESTGRIYFEYSTDGVDWTGFGDVASTGIDTANVFGGFAAGTFATELLTTVAKIDSLNVVVLTHSIGGTLKLTGGLSRSPTGIHASITGTLLLVGIVDAVIEPILQAAKSKVYEYKIYDPDTGNFLGRWDDVISNLQFSTEINQLGPAIDVELARNSDSLTRQFDVIADDTGQSIITDDGLEISAETQTTNSIGPGTTVDLNLDIKIYVFTEDSMNIGGDLIFTGFISKYTSNYGKKESTIVSIFSYGADLDNYVLEDAGKTRVPYLSMDPSAILKNALDKFNVDGGIPSYYDTNNVYTRNLTQNPSVEVDTTGITGHGIGSTPTRITTDGAFGVASMQVVRLGLTSTTGGVKFNTGENIVPLAVYTMSAYVKGTAGQNTTYGWSQGSLTFYTNVGTVNFDGTWQRVSFTFTTTSEVGTIAFVSRTNLSITWFVDAVMITKGSILYDYFDGDTVSTDPDVAYTWEGTSGKSISRRTFAVPTVDDTGTVVSYTFNVNTIYEVLKKCLELAPTDWYFYYDPGDNVIHFHDRPTTPTHTFILGKHILELNLEQYIEELVNTVYFTGGDDSANPGTVLFKKYVDPSVSTYRRGLARLTDNRVTLEDSADIIVQSLIDRSKGPRYRSSITISDKVYPIETIHLGELAAFGNFGNYVDAIQMQIVKIDYSPNAVTLQLDTLLPSVPKRLEDIKRNLNQTDNADNPDTPQT